MSDTPWTKGPWRVAGGSVQNDFLIEAIESRYGVGEAWNLNGRPENEANANLIAAAPDMAEALEPLAGVATDRAVDAPEWRDSDTVSVMLTIGELRAARAALAKARGQA